MTLALTSDALNRAVQLTERLCALPAVATAAWADQAAEALTAIDDGCVALVLIAEVDERGRVSSREAAGAAARGRGAEGAGEVLTLRSGAERAAELGFAPATLLGGGCGVARAEDLLGQGWTRTGIGAAWPAGASAHAVIGMHALGQGEGRRVIVTGVGLGEAPRDASWPASMLGAAMPVLAHRALLAVGARPSGASRWLTSREQAVLERLALGRSVREIADEIGRSPHTVHDHVKSLHRKLNASSRGELVARALGYIDDSHRVLGALGGEAKGGTAADTSGLRATIRGDGTIVEPKPDAREPSENER